MVFIRGRTVLFLFAFVLFFSVWKLQIKLVEGLSHFLVMPLSGPQAGLTAVCGRCNKQS